MIFTHFRHDLHQDHRFLCELTWNTFRNHLILEYEIPKYDADLGSPNFFVPLSRIDLSTEGTKVDARYFGTQRNKQWFSEDLFHGLMRLRGELKPPRPRVTPRVFIVAKMLLDTVA